MLPRTALFIFVTLFGDGFCKDVSIKSEKRGVDSSVSYSSSGFVGGRSSHVTPGYSNGYNTQHATPSGYTSLHGTPASYTNFHSTPSYSSLQGTSSYSGLHSTPSYSTLHGTPSPPFHSTYHNQQPIIHAVNPYSVAISQRYQPFKLSLVKLPQPIFVPRIILQPFDHQIDHISPFTYPH